VARERKRSKQRRGRKPAQSVPDGSVSGPLRADLPGALDHASGEVDEFDAALLRGAGGVPAPDALTDGDLGLGGDEGGLGLEDGAPAGNGAGSGGGPTLPPREGARRARRRGSTAEAEGIEVAAQVHAPATEQGQSLPARAMAFLRASWAELQRVQWPDRQQVTQATAVVLGFVAVAGAYFGLADYIAKEVVEAIL
jgi:preprotein translocase SecE subunit